MKRLLFILPILGLAACANQHPDSTPTTAAYHDDALPQNMRDPSHVHTYLVNDYIDPNNPRLRHRGHPVDVVEQDEKWSLDAAEDRDDGTGNYGPATAADDSNAAPNPYSAEFETELMQQRNQSSQLADLGAKMTAEMGKLEEMAEKEADAVAENATLHTRLQDLQREIDQLKPPPTPPVSPMLQKAVLVGLHFDLFRQLPNGTPVVQEKPAPHSVITLRPIPPSSAEPTNTIEEIESPGEIAEPQNNSRTNTP